MKTKKSYEHPHSGIFYMVPNKASLGTYTIYSEFQEGGEDVAHLFLFDKVKKILESRFKVDLEGVDAYTGIPRGRIIEHPQDIHGSWIVAHGGDFPLDRYRETIISEFLLRDAIEIGKVKWEIEDRKSVV